MANLKDILYGITLLEVEGDRNKSIGEIVFDSRKAGEGCLFVAIKGLRLDGHDYISEAITLGAVAVICEQFPKKRAASITYVKTNNSTLALGLAASNFYENPSSKLKLVGITGTNGKTTTVTLLHELFLKLGYKAGLLSTVENKINHRVLPSDYTTPDALRLNQLLAQMADAGCTHAFMEVSSHALVQHRVAGVSFKGAVFTNISHDHLDYHKTFDNYIAAKKLLFDGLGKTSFSLSNADDKRCRVMLQNTKSRKHTYGIKSAADFKSRILSNSIHGLQLDVDGWEVWFKLIGGFNAYNILSVYATAVLLGEEKEQVLATLSGLDRARGRFEQIANTQGVIAIVDYAHTPDALDNVLRTIDELRTRNETLVTVVGCGGDRDKTKRPEMARIAVKLSDKVILTSDNPRTEDPESIMDDMMKGVLKSERRKAMRVTNRAEAIRVACNLAKSEDIVLVAGKGHEDYQEIHGKRTHFDDREILNYILNQG